jgi:hypothetical protein
LRFRFGGRHHGSVSRLASRGEHGAHAFHLLDALGPPHELFGRGSLAPVPHREERERREERDSDAHPGEVAGRRPDPRRRALEPDRPRDVSEEDGGDARIEESHDDPLPVAIAGERRMYRCDAHPVAINTERARIRI